MIISLRDLISYVEYGIVGIGLIVMVYGVIDSALRLFISWIKRADFHVNVKKTDRESVRKHLGTYIILALEFFIAADILRTVLHPTWDEIGVLAAIVGIRTVLSMFLNFELKYFK